MRVDLGDEPALRFAGAAEFFDRFDGAGTWVPHGVRTARGDEVVPRPAGLAETHVGDSELHFRTDVIDVMPGLTHARGCAGGGVEHRHVRRAKVSGYSG